MSLLLTMLPFYLIGNLHCLGMCGPLVMMIGQHRWRYFYFLGRTFSFTLAGWIAGELGRVSYDLLVLYRIPELTCFFFGGIIFTTGLYSLMGWRYPGYQWIAKRLASTEKKLSLMMLRDQAWTTFFFGLFTIALPCGQTIVVFSACALSANGLSGLLNGLVFSLLTSPSLLLAMNAHLFLRGLRPHYHTLMGVIAMVVGGVAICRGLAETGAIAHLVLDQIHPHLVIY